jgi:hypothetical protein
MPAITSVSLSADLKSQILEGFTPSERKIMLSAATQRRFAADDAITNQGCLADNLYPADGRPRPTFLCVRSRREATPSVAGTTGSDRRSDSIVGTFFVSPQHGNGNGQFGVGVGSQHKPRTCRTVHQVAGERVVTRVRLCDLAPHVLHRNSLLHRAPAACDSAGHAFPDDWEKSSGRYCSPYYQRGVGERGERHAFPHEPPD